MRTKKYTCQKCNLEQEEIGIVQSELCYYRMDLYTGQWKDFHGDTDVLSQNYFCIECKEPVSDSEVGDIL